jgi:MFS superfamily sulfate permease-like transporter
MSPNELFGPANIVTTAGATAAVTFATNAICYLIPRLPRKWPAFVGALVIAYLAVMLKDAPLWYEWILAFFNACLLFCSALGLNAVAVAIKPEKSGVAAGEEFFKPWLGKAG